MRVKTAIVLIIGLLSLIGIVAAADTSTFSISKDWVIANGVDQSVITIYVSNDIGIKDTPTVKFTVDPLYGKMDPESVTADMNTAKCNFLVNTTSGIAIITAEITYTDISDNPVSVELPIGQNIDHDVHFSLPTVVPAEGTVEEVIPFVISFTDIWGNPIDNRRPDAPVSLSVACPVPNDCEFVGYGQSYSSQPDSNGNLEIPLRLGTKSGLTSIVMSPVQNLLQHVFLIDANPGDPDLKVDISPTTLTVPVNTGVFYFTYTISDDNDNPFANEPVHIVTSLGEQLDTTTNSFGRTPILSYGPKSIVNNAIHINATSGNLTNNITVAFSTTETKNLALYVLPESMPSLDVDPTSHADVVGKVVDIYGNPISGQNLEYTLTCSAADPTEDAAPYLTNYGGLTNENGYVDTIFIPGSFNSTADKEGSCQLAANWLNNPSYPPQTVTLTWVNYPYVSIYTGVPLQTVSVNDTIDVTISIVGTGKEPEGGPVSVMLDLDASSNFAKQGVRVDKAKNATATFVANLSSQNALSQLGLVSYGDGDNEVLHLSPTTNHALVLANINGTFGNMSGGVQDITVKDSIDEAVIRIMGPPPPNKVRAIISLGDSAYTNEAELPGLIKETWTDNQIRVFSIFYASELGNGGCGAATDSKYLRMKALADQTGGKSYPGCDEGTIIAAFADIADILRRLSAENATLSVSFSNIAINNTTSLTGSQVYDYIPVDIPAGLPPSIVSSPNATVNSNARSSIIWTDGNQSIVNQINEWPELKFNVGTIEIGKTWSATFRLKVKQPGCYNVFGTEGSELVFNGGSNNLSLPDLPICVLEEPDNQGFKTGTLSVTEFQPSSSGPFTDFVPLQWNTHYNSTVSTNNATEYVSYNNGGPWIQFDVKSAPTGDSNQSTSLDVRNLPIGIYHFWVHATAGDANEDNDYINNLTVGIINRSYMKLQ